MKYFPEELFICSELIISCFDLDLQKLNFWLLEKYKCLMLDLFFPVSDWLITASLQHICKYT